MKENGNRLKFYISIFMPRSKFTVVSHYVAIAEVNDFLPSLHRVFTFSFVLFVACKSSRSSTVALEGNLGQFG